MTIFPRLMPSIGVVRQPLFSTFEAKHTVAEPTTFGAAKKAGKETQKPPALKPGDTIALIAPATPISQKDMDENIRYLKSQGYQVVQYARTDLHDKHYLSDTDRGRANAINRAFANQKVKAVFSVQGGGGTFRPDFLKHIDWETVRKNPKILTGFSDITFLHHAMYTQANLTTFHSGFPNKEAWAKKNTKAFWDMVAPKKPDIVPLPIQAGGRYKCLVPGEVTGKLVGGNLSLLSATVGSKYQIPLTGKEILFIEDWNDDYESVDRLISHLSHNGVWDNVAGLIVGEFYLVPKKRGDYSLKWEPVITDILKEARKRNIPIGINFPIGHNRNNRPMPLGVEAHFNSKTGTLSFLESPVENHE